MGVGTASLKGTAPRVSVIVPARNSSASLELLVGALSRQTFHDFEVVVIDDGSEDGTHEVACRQDEIAVRCIRTDGVGAVRARCAGVAEARGEILAFTDSDCLPDRSWLAEGVAAIDAGADLVQGRTVPQRPVGPLERSVGHGDDGLFATCNVFYRRSAFEEAGGFDLRAYDRLGFRPTARSRGLGFGEDTLLGWDVKRRGNFVHVPDAVVRHEVLRPGVRDLVSRAWMAGAFPPLLREVPELRPTLVRHGAFLGRPSLRLLVYPTAGTLAAGLAPTPFATGLRGAAAVLAATWVAGRAWRTLRMPGSRKDRALAVGVALAVDVATCTALVAGSMRARKVLL